MVKEYKEMTEEEEITEMCKDILEMLVKTRKKIDDKFTEYGYDAAFFNINIDLKVQIDKACLRIKDKWKALPLY